jgi:hypothetical protein
MLDFIESLQASSEFIEHKDLGLVKMPDKEIVTIEENKLCV